MSFSQNIVRSRENVNCSAVIVVLHDINLACFVNLFIIVVIMLYDVYVMKSVDSESSMMKFNVILWYEYSSVFSIWSFFYLIESLCLPHRTFWAFFYVIFHVFFKHEYVYYSLNLLESFCYFLMFHCFWLMHFSNDIFNFFWEFCLF